MFSDGEHAITKGVTFSYKVKGADDSTYSSEQPTQAGDYTVRAVVQASGTAYDGTYTSDFSVARKPVTATVIADDKDYDGTTTAKLVAYVEDEDVLAGDSVTIGVVSGSFADANAGDVKQVNVEQGSAVVSGTGSQNYDVTIPETTVGTINKAWAAVWADDVTVQVGQSVPEPFTAHAFVPVKGDELVYTLSCDYEQKAGVYDIVVDLDESVVPNCNYDVAVIPGKLTITEAELTVVAESYAGTYDGQAHGITVDVLPTTANAKVYYSAERDLTPETARIAGTLINPTFTDAGSHRVYYFVLAHNGQMVSGSKEVVINKAEPEVKAPTPIEGLRYTGSPQTLINAGSAVGGTMEYSLDGLSWSTELPQATDVGPHSVMYRVTGDGNHLDVAARPISTVIQKKLEPTVVLDSWTYGSPAKTPVFTDGEKPITKGVTFSYKVKGADDSTYSSEQPTQAGDYTVRAVVQASGTAYDGTYTSDFSVARKPVTATVIADDKDYDGTTTAKLVAYVEDEDVLAGDSVTIGVVSGSFADANAGDVKQVNVDQGSAVVSGRGSQNYDVTIPETTVGTINKAWAAVWADDVTVQVGQSVPEPFKAHALVPVKGDELVYTLSCEYEPKVGVYDIVVDLDESVVPNCNYDVAVIPGKLTITEAELTVVARSPTRAPTTARPTASPWTCCPRRPTPRCTTAPRGT